MFRSIFAIFVAVFCFCDTNPVVPAISDDMNYIKYSQGEKNYTVAENQNKNKFYSDPASSFIQFRFGIDVFAESDDTAFVIGATTDNSSINITFPRKYTPAVYEMKRDNQTPGFRCFYSDSSDSNCYFETPDKFNSKSSISNVIGSLEITKFDTSERVIEGRFQFRLYKMATNLTSSTVFPQNDSICISNGSFKYHWTDVDIKKSFIPDTL